MSKWMGHRLISRQSSCPEATAIHILDIPGWVFVPVHRARDTVAFLERKVLDFIPPTMWPTNSPDLNPVDYIFCSVLQEKVYPSRISNVDELKACLIVEAAIAEWQRCLGACVHVSRAHFEHQFQQVHKFSYFVIYLPKVIKLMTNWWSFNTNFYQFQL